MSFAALVAVALVAVAAFAKPLSLKGWLGSRVAVLEDDEIDDMPRQWRRPIFVAPKPEDAHTNAEYFEKVAVPFWRKHIVETFHAPEGMDEKTAARVLKVREALVRKLATARLEFPTGAEYNEANNLWNGA